MNNWKKKCYINYREANNLLKNTESICPKCNKKLPAIIYEKDGKVMIKKTCDIHGDFEDVYWSDYNMYLKAKEWSYDGDGVSNPKTRSTQDCPNECGLCNNHLTHTILGLIDLVDYCNMECPGCFAGAKKSGKRDSIYRLSFDQVKTMMEELKSEQPVRCVAIQFSGGEPTLHPDLPRIIKEAKDLGFTQIQVATNGRKMAKMDYCQKLYDAGLNTVYLQFDGFKEQTHAELRVKDKWKNFLKEKMQVIENCRNVKRSEKANPLAVVLVPTIKKTINDDEVGIIINYAIENKDVIRGVNFQPYSFSKDEEKEIRTKRYTISDLIHDLEKQTNFLKKEFFYPVPSVIPISQFVSAFTGKPKMTFSAHPHCGMATIILFGKDKQNNLKLIPLPRILDVDGVLHKIKKLTKYAKLFKIIGKLIKSPLEVKRKLKKSGRFRIFEKNSKLFKKFDWFEFFFGGFLNKAEESEDVIELIKQLMRDIFSKEGKDPFKYILWKGFYIGGMHFQDNWNYDLERLRRCCIHYATPDGRIIPFCAYNSGPTYRKQIEKQFSVPLEK